MTPQPRPLPTGIPPDPVLRFPPAPSANWKRRALIALGVVLALAGAFSAGRFSAPEQVREVEKVVWRDKVVEKVVTRKAKAEERIVYVDRVVSPTGEVREKRTTHTLANTRDLVDATKAVESSGSSTSSSTTTLRPDWRVGVLVGASLREPLVPIAGPLVIGASVERRIVGGLSAGAWVNTVGAAGASVSMEF